MKNCTEGNNLEKLILDLQYQQRTRKQWSLLRASSNADIIDTVQLINESSDRIEKSVSGNTERIDERSKNIDVAFAEMKETENKMCEM